MGARGIGGAAGNVFTYSFNSANSLAWVIGDLVQWDGGANFTVKKCVNDTIPFGRVVAISGPTTATSATSTILTIEVFAYNKAVVINSDATVALSTGVSAQSNGTANYIETATLAYNGGLVIGTELQSDSTYNITVLY